MPDQPYILAIESSGDAGGAAILCGDEVLAESVMKLGRAHGQYLVPSIDRAVSEAAIGKERIGLILVNQGPGSYTGLRVGVAAAEALGAVLNIPVVGVPCLEIMCEELLRLGGVTPGTTLLPALDARRDEVLAAAFGWDGTKLARQCDDSIFPVERLGEAASGGMVFGDGAAVYTSRVPKSFVQREQPLSLRPATVAMAAQRLWGDMAALCNAPRQRVALRYFRPILAKTITERDEEAAQRHARAAK